MTTKKYKFTLPLLCSDPIFKCIFIKCPFVLKKFIYDITGEYFNNISIGTNELSINKIKRCDFIINTDKNIIINIELNKVFSKTMLVKNTSYLFNLFSTYSLL